MHKEPPQRLHVENIVLREFQAHDHADLLMAFQDSEVGLWNPQTTDATQVTAWAAARNDRSSGSHFSWAVCDVANRLVGSVSLREVDLRQGDAEAGYWVAPWARRRGVALRALTAVTACGFATWGLHRICLHHAVDNVPSCSVATRAGFALEGILRQSHSYGDGARHDEHLHARLSTDTDT